LATEINRFLISLICLAASFFVVTSNSIHAASSLQPSNKGLIEIKDSIGRLVTIPSEVNRVICSGAGCLRLLTYLQGQDKVVAVDSMETKGMIIDARPYAIANPRFKDCPLFGELRGRDNPELIVSLKPLPQVIFKTCSDKGESPSRLTEKTQIPVVVLDYGSLTKNRADLNKSLKLMALIIGKPKRAEEVIEYLNNLQEDLQRRTKDITDAARPSCYIGGLGGSGAHGLPSTESLFEPFLFTNARNVAADASSSEKRSKASVSKEQIVFWDPDIIFLDVSTLLLSTADSAVNQLRNDPAYGDLTAVRKGRVYGLFPYNSYHHNFGATFANAYFAGKILYPDRFKDVDPMIKAEEISSYLNGGPAFEILKKQYQGLPFSSIKVREN
jgi:iron complex transport system substrate-binding protein